MTWFDMVAFVALVLIAWVESMRGFGRALFDLVGGIIVLKLAPVLAGPLAASFHTLDGKGANQAFWLALVFVVFAAVVVVLGRLIHQSTLLSLDYLDPVLGGLFGVVIGLIVVFFFLRSVQLTYGTTQPGQLFMDCFVAQEVLELRSFHKVVTALQNLGKV